MTYSEQLIDEIRTCRVLAVIEQESGVTAEDRLCEFRDRMARVEHLALLALHEQEDRKP